MHKFWQSRISPKRRRKNGERDRRFHFEPLEGRRVLANTFQVNTAGAAGDFDPNDGHCDSDSTLLGDQITFAAAAMCVNAGDGDRITFGNVSGAIPLDFGITKTVTVDGGDAQLSFTGTLNIQSNGSTVQDLVGANVNIAGNSCTVINSDLKSLAFIGDGNTLQASRISGSGTYGLQIIGSNNNVVNNLIGTDASGTAAVANNSDGILISGSVSASANNMIVNNVISGNKGYGIYIVGSMASGNHIEGNRIGVDINGTGRLGNGLSGIQIENSPNNIVGGDTVAKRNIIGDNKQDGIILRKGFPDHTTGNIIAGNYIGVGIDGTTDLGNRFNGIQVRTGVSDVTIQNNVISGNGEFSGAGVMITGTDVELLGNKIGTKADGSGAVANNGAGIRFNHSTGNDGCFIIIGGADSGDLSVGNLISGNGGSGIETISSGIHDITIRGNRIGTNAAGSAVLGNSSSGISLTGEGFIIGGGTGEGNLISANGGDGISISGGVANADNIDAIRIQGNTIGLNADGDTPLGNAGRGISIFGTGVTVGRYLDLDTDTLGSLSQKNVISGNFGAGVYVGEGSTEVRIVGNFIGTSRDGLHKIGNQDGVFIENATLIRVGDYVKGAGNLISGNRAAGVHIRGIDAKTNFVHSNKIGLADQGDSDLGNTGPGVFVEQEASHNLIGSPFLVAPGDVTKLRNHIAFNGEYGVLITGENTDSNDVENNHIGYLESTGEAPGNKGGGIALFEGADDGRIDNNVVSGHVSGLNDSPAFGIGIIGTSSVKAKDIFVNNNLIGVDHLVSTVRGNQAGLFVKDATEITIRNNKMAGGVDENIMLNSVTEVDVFNNILGQDLSDDPLVSPGNGIVIVDSRFVEIGGSINQNVIANHQGHGIYIRGTSDRVAITQNSIHSNGGKGIELEGRMKMDAVRPVLSSFKFGPSVQLWGSMTVEPGALYNLEFFGNSSADPSGFGEGEKFLEEKFLQADANGLIQFNFPLFSNDVPQFVTATATRQYSDGRTDTTYDFSHHVHLLQLESAVIAVGNAVAGAVGWAVDVITNAFPHAQAAAATGFGSGQGQAAAADPIPTGPVLFYDNGVQIGSATLDANGHAEFTSGQLGPGVHHLYTVYEGDANFFGNVSEQFLTTVEGGPLGISGGQGGTNPDDEGRGVVVDSSGNSYVVGVLKYADGASDSTSTKTGDIFLAKYDKFGTQVWQRTLGSSGDDRGLAIARDSSNNIYVTGTFQGTVDFNPSSTVNNLTSRGGFDIFVASYTKTGTYRWAHNYGNTSSSSSNADIGYGIAVSADGNVLVTGQFGGTVDFDASSSTLSLKSKGTSDIFVMRLTSGGSTSWAKQIGGTEADRGTAVTTDASNRVYVTGSFNGTVDFDPSSTTKNLTSAGGKDAFLARYSSGGSYSYARRIGGTSNDEGHAVVVDPSSNVYLTGYFAGTADLDPGSSTKNVTGAGSNDVFIVKLDSSGNYSWGKRVGGSGDDRGRGISRLSNGDIAVIGDFSGTVDFDPSSTTKNKSSHGSTDAFFLRLSSGGSYKSAVAIGGTGVDRGRAIAVDKNDKLYALGHFFESLALDTGEGTVNLTSSGGKDLFLVRLV